MDKVKYIIFLLLIVTNFCQSQQSKNDKQNFKNSIELSIITTNDKLKPLIQKINFLLKERKSDNALMEMYNEAKSTIQSNKELINQLVEVDNKINLKSGTLKYLENCERIQDIFVLPLIKFLNESGTIDRNTIKEAFALAQSTIKETSDLSDLLGNFCSKYKLSRELREFEKVDYKQKIEEIQTKLGN